MVSLPLELKNLDNNKELCLNLLHSESEDKVIQILDDAGYSLDNENSWLPLGDNPGNFSSIGNQQAEATAALVEKIVNSVDAVLLSECYKKGVDPESDAAPKTMSEAVDVFLGVKDGRLDNLSPTQQTELAENIRIMVTGSKSSPCISIIDNGEGQTPNSFKNTFLSTTSSSPKIRIPFVQGKFNAGSTGSLQFCGNENVQLIISRSQPHCLITRHDDSAMFWGFTVIRRKRPKHGEKASVFEYLAPQGEILKFSAECLEILPTKSSANNPGRPYSEPLEYGTCVKLYNYRWSGRSLATTEARRYLEKRLQAPCLPFRIHETRDYKANYYDTTVIGVWNKIKGEIIDKDDGDVEKGFPADLMVSIQNIGNLKLKIVVWKNDIDIRNVPTGVFFLVNGQVHGDCGDGFITRRTNLDYIANHLLVAVDCTDTDRDVHEDLFMPSRDRLRENEHNAEIKKILAQEIKDHPGLKEINAIWKQRLRDKAIDSKDDVVHIFNELIKTDPSLANVLGLGVHIHGGVGPGEPKIFEGRKFPTYFRIANEPKTGLVKRCPMNRTVTVEFETDADNDYFSRPGEPGELSIEPSIDLIESSRLWNGRFNLRFRVPWDAKIGDELDIRVIVTDVTNVAKPFESKFKLIAINNVTKITPPGPHNPPVDPYSPNPKLNNPKFNLPEPIAVNKPDWKKYGFESSKDALRIKRSDDGYDFYWNTDNKYLIYEMSNKNQDIELVKQWFKWGLTIAALGMIKSEIDAEKESDKNSDDDIGVDLKKICAACDGLSMVIVPIIRSLHDLPLNKLE